MSDTRDQASETAGRRPVERAASFRHFNADAAVVEPTHNQIAISFLIESSRPASVDWPNDSDQPLGVGLKRLVEEIAAVRMLPETANVLALELLVELVRTGLSRESIEHNFALVRGELDRQEKTPVGGERA